MSDKSLKKPLAAAVGATFAAALTAAPAASADTNPFGMQSLQGGYLQLADGHEGKCGEGKCGEKEKEAKCGEGKCGGMEKGAKEKEAKCGEGKCGGKEKEAKCGEGKCGGKN